MIKEALSSSMNLVTSSDTEKRSLSRTTVLMGKLLYYGLIFISFLILLAPILIVVAISVNPTREEAFPPNGFSLEWYVEFLQHPEFFHSFFVVSLPIAIITAFIATLLGVLAAYVLVRRELPVENAIQAVLIVPLMVPAVIIGLALMLFFARNDLQYPFFNLIIGHTIIAIPFTFLTAATSLYNVDTELEEAARNLGASHFETFYKVTLPLMRSGLIAGFLFAFIISFSDINVALFLSGGDHITLPLRIFLFLQWESSPIIAAISTVQIGLILVLVLLIGKLVGFKSFAR